MNYRISDSVGKGGSNSPKDVKLVQALLNVYRRREGKKSLTLTGKPDPDTLSAIEIFQKTEQKLLKPDGRIDASGQTFKSLKKVLDGVLKDNQPLIKPTEGVVTFDAEGAEGGFYHSRILHVASETSGLTLGRGYDMKEKASTKISADLIKAGVDAKIALTISKASSLFGTNAWQLVINNDLLDFQISPSVQKRLFEITFADESDEAKRVCTLARIEKIYGKCKWDEIDYRIKEIVVDLKFRGDYTEESRKFIQDHIVKNDFVKFKDTIVNKSNWTAVPADRFERRKRFLATAEKKK